MKRRGLLASLFAPLVARFAPKTMEREYIAADGFKDGLRDPAGRVWLLLPDHSDAGFRPRPEDFGADIRAAVGDVVNFPVLLPDQECGRSRFGNLSYRRIY